MSDFYVCPVVDCGRRLNIYYENNGFTPPDPTHYDAYAECPVHGRVDPVDESDE